MFKQRKRKKGSRRTPSVRDNDVAEDKNGDRADDSNNGESHDDVKERLEIMRALQKSRSKRPGLFLKAQLEEEDDAGKAQRESEVAEQSSMKRLKKLGAAFQQKATENFEDEYLERYVEETMKNLRGAPEKKKVDKTKARDEDESEILESPLKKRKEAKESGDRWLAGIAEVPISIDDRLKNIEETEQATLDLLRKQRSKVPTSNLPSNVSSNFQFSEYTVSHSEASDTRVLSSFKKRMYHRR